MTERVSVLGSPSTPGFQVRYFGGGTDVTAAVLAGTYATPEFAPDATHTLTVRVTVGLLAPLLGSHSAVVTATSPGNPTRDDTVKAVTRTR